MKKRLPIVVLVLVAAAVTYWVVRGDDGATDGVIAASGTVEATDADLGFQLGGRIAEIAAREGETVAEGAVLARLDTTELGARRAQAEAQLAAARARLLELERGTRPEEQAQARSASEAARQRMEESRRVLERTRTLFTGGAVSRESLEQAETAHAVAAAQYEQAQEQERLVIRGPRAEQILAQQAVVRTAEASVAQVDALLDQAIVHAPFTGIVTVRHREAGETVAPGAPIVTLMDPASRWVRIYVREDQIGRVSLGQGAQIISDSHADSAFAGRVIHIASEAEFTPRNVQTAEERVKLVYAVKVAIEDDGGLVLKPGVPADVRLGTERL
ncbi:MAG: HlyD family secretion protein [Longimicrobiales bacterium]